MKKLYIRIFTMLTLLLLGGMANQAWAYKITYHILTLPMTSEIPGNTVAEYNDKGWRMEALRVVVDNVTKLQPLPAHFQSPLADNFKYYANASVTKDGTAREIYANNHKNIYFLYRINGEDTPDNDSDDAAPMAIGDDITSNCDIYVTYKYNENNGIAKLDGSEKYIIGIHNGFLAYNKGRNNRLAVMPKTYNGEYIVEGESLCSDNFNKVDINGKGTNIRTWWNDNKTPRATAESYFHFLFKYEGCDPYNITIMTAYKGEDCYYEKWATDANIVKKYYKWGSVFSTQKLDNDELLLASDDNRKYTTPYTDTGGTVGYDETMVGYYRAMDGHIWNSFALLNNTNNDGYVYIGTRCVDGNGNISNPSNNQYYYLQVKTNNELKYTLMNAATATANSSVDKKMYEVFTYTFHVTTPFGNVLSAEKNWPEPYGDVVIQSKHVPTSLLRKYCSIVGFYKDAALTQPITTFGDATDKHIYVKYQVTGAPFNAIRPSDSYSDATWYELTDADHGQSDGMKLEWDGSAFQNNGEANTYKRESEFAFVGDPYELRVLYRDATKTDGEKRYVGGTSTLGVAASDYFPNNASNFTYGTSYTYDTENLASGTKTISFILSGLNGSKYIKVTKGGTDGEAQVASTIPTLNEVIAESSTVETITVTLNANAGVAKTMTITVQEYDDSKGNSASGTATVITINQLVNAYSWEIPSDATSGSFLLQQYGSKFSTTSSYWQWDTSSKDNPVGINTTIGTPVKVMELPKLNYTFKVVDLSGRVAIQATEALTPFTKLTGYANIPASIRSPFLSDETVTFHSSYDGSGRGNLTNANKITEVPGDNTPPIYVSYTTSALSSKNIKLSSGQQFNVKLNGVNIYHDYDSGTSTSTIRSNSATTESDLLTNNYLWQLEGEDPYAMKIYNKGKGEYVKAASWADDQALGFDSDINNASRFIAMMSNNVGVYEVMAATGSSSYYHIGRPTDNAEVKVYSRYAHGADELRFELFGQTTITYTLIDRAGAELITVESKNPRLALPSDYVSPLVSEYYYYSTKAFAEYYRTNGTSSSEEGGAPITEISQDTDGHVWVVYDPVQNVFGDKHPHLLKFLNGLSYHLEDGADKLTTDPIKAMYPYFNGDGNLNIYGNPMKEEQMGGGSSTRPRWVWFFESANNDPYHVKIYSRNTISYSGGNHHGFLHTYAVHFNQDANANEYHIVTGVNFRGISTKADTEYMIVGVTGRYKLMTTYPVPVDLNEDGDTSDAGETAGERQVVTSFEQYWKTYNMLKLHVLGISASTDEFSEESKTFVVPSADDPNTTADESTYRSRITAKGWHSYSAVANATRWNGYNNLTGSDGHTKKIVEELEHWFQTFEMGNGEFDIESGDIPAVLVLLDRHGWEIMRKPLPTGSDDPDREAKLAALSAYDSPMVKEYQFWSSASKASGCHKYYGMGKAITQSASSSTAFTSTSLASLPPLTAQNVKDNMGNIQDQYVTYTVKEEYENSYTYNYINGVESSTASTFIILQNGQYAEDVSSTLTAQTAPTAPSNLSSAIIAGSFGDASLWYAQPNLNIDEEMGITWAETTGNKGEPFTKEETKEKYKGKTGFDPYNLQLVNKNTGKYLTTNMTDSELSGGAYVGDYAGTGGSYDVTLAAKSNGFEAEHESYDHTNLVITNQTFMAVQDANGNMQLMPRFDHAHRINAFTTLADPVQHNRTADVDDPTSGDNAMGAQTTFLVRPVVHEYRIIDNDGNVAMHYRTGGESYPSIPEHFKSPLATNFRYYATLNDANNDGVYELPSLANEITSSFAAAGVTYDSNNRANIYIRYEYDESADIEHDNILQGKWMTVSLGNNWVYYNGTLNTGSAGLYTNTKPATSEDLKAAKQWHWKFLQNPMAETSARYKAPDPYAVEIYNREANNSDADMATAISVGGVNRYVILSHPDGDYALAKASDDLASYSFLNGNGMTAHGAVSAQSAQVLADLHFSTSNNDIDDGARIIFSNDIKHTYVYNVITNAHHLAASKEQIEAVAISNGYKPVTPEEIQTPLLNLEDYIYYGTATESEGVYTIDQESQLRSLYGLYDDVVYVRYQAFSRDKTPYMVPNDRNNASPVAVGAESNDVAIDINDNLPYNIIWKSDNMMRSSDGVTIIDGGANIHEGKRVLSAESQDMWHFTGGDPYAIAIKHDDGIEDKYVTVTGTLNATPTTFMLLKREGYDYGVLAMTGNQGTMLTFGDDPNTYAEENVLYTTTSAPQKFIPFALSVYHLIYHLVINNIGSSTDIPYRTGEEGRYTTADTWLSTDVTTVNGTTLRDLTTTSSAIPGETYQLGETITYQLGETVNSLTYSHDAGKVGLGDVMEIPSSLSRPNCHYDFYVQDVYDNYNTGTKTCSSLNSDLNNKYKGLNITELMSGADLIGKTLVINVTYSFDNDPSSGTNSGEDFVTEMKPVGTHYLWYTFETAESTPQLAHYTNVRGMRAESGRALHYTNDYLWSPLGDPYGFISYNRYVYKNNGLTTNVLTTASIANDEEVVMGATGSNEERDIYELLESATPGSGSFRVHPLLDGTNKIFLSIDEDGKLILSNTTPVKEWTYGLSEELLNPYYQGAGNVGGLTPAGKTAYEKAQSDYASKPAQLIRELQKICYNNTNIVPFAEGFYRLSNQPGASSISPQRYASGYLHLVESTDYDGNSAADDDGDGNEATDVLPMHFYSRVGTSTTFKELASGGIEDKGYTKSVATQGDIPVLATEYDPSTIFQFTGTADAAKMQTQGLYVMGAEDSGYAKMTADVNSATSFHVDDIGGAVVVIYNLDGSKRHYINYYQGEANHIYDLQYFENVPVDGSKWCMEPAKTQGLMVETHAGGDGYYYCTFCAPFDVSLPDDAASKTYNAYVCTTWNTDLIYPKKVAASSPYTAGKFVPAATPVIIRTNDTSGKVKLSIPNTTTTKLSCVFTGTYLEQLLAAEISETDMVYTFGLPITGYNITIGSGEITHVVNGVKSNTGVGFYRNATPNKEFMWTRNNRYVLHNRIYYRGPAVVSVSPSRQDADTRGVQFIPVIFDVEEEQPGDEQTAVNGLPVDNRIYDLQGRCVATEQQVLDGTWRTQLSRGIYILNGRKFRK